MSGAEPWQRPSIDLPAIDEMAGRRRWVCFRPEERKGKLTKVPVRPDGRNAQSNNSKSWSLFEACCVAVEAGRHDLAGVGFVFHREQGDESYLIGIDLDKCRDPETGEIQAWAREIADRLRSYTEVSWSGTGLHIIVKGQLPDRSAGRREGLVECYADGRYFCMTGQALDDWPHEIVEDQAALDWFWATHIRPNGGNGHNHGATAKPPRGSATSSEDDKNDPVAFHLASGRTVRRSELITPDPADFPWGLHNALCDNDPVFKRTWERKRKDLEQSLNTYDMALAVRATMVRWTKPQVAALIQANRRRQGDPDKGERVDYVTRTVLTAEEWMAKGGTDDRHLAQTEQGSPGDTPTVEPSEPEHVATDGIGRFLTANGEAAAAYHGFSGHTDRGPRDRRLAELAGEAGLSDPAVRELLTTAKPVGGVETPTDLEELVARARASRAERPGVDASAALDLIRNRLRAPVRRVIAKVGLGERPPVVSFQLETEDGQRVDIGDPDEILNQNHAKAAFIRSGLPAFDDIKRPAWLALIRAIQAAAEPEQAGDLDPGTRLTEMLARAIRHGGTQWSLKIRHEDDPEATHSAVGTLRRNPHPYLYPLVQGRLWVPSAFISKEIAMSGHLSIDRWSPQKVWLMLPALGWLGHKVQIRLPVTPSRPPVPKVGIRSWTPPPDLAAELLRFWGVSPDANEELDGDA